MAIWNFAFGSHLSKTRLREIIGQEPTRAMRAILPDHRLTFWKLSRVLPEYAKLASGGSPALVPAQGHRVHGVVYEISERQLVVLDKYEKEWDYERVQVRVQLEDGRSLLAYAHNRTEPNEFAPPSGDFLLLMMDGLRQHGYSNDVIQEVRETAAP